jgi:hypothetical protein
MINAITLDSQYSQNVVNPYLGFMMPPNYQIVSGTGVLEPIRVQTENNLDNSFVFKGNHALQFLNSNYQNNDLEFNGIGSDYAFMTERPTNYFLSFYLLREFSTAPNTTLELDVFISGTLQDTISFALNSETMPNVFRWYRFGQLITFEEGFDYTFRWRLKSQSSYPTNLISFYLDGFAIQKANFNNFSPYPYTLPRPLILEVSSEIDIPSISSNSTYLLSVELLGARIGDYVSIDYPNELLTLGLIVGTPIVSDTDEVSVLIHNHSGGSINAGLGNYKFRIVK